MSPACPPHAMDHSPVPPGAVVAGLPDASLLLDRHGLIQYANPAFLRVFCLPGDDVQARRPGDLLSGLPAACGFQNGPPPAPLCLEAEVGSPGRAPFPARLALSPVRAEDFQGWLLQIQDISGWKAVESELATTAGKYRDIFENSVEGIFQTTPSGTYLAVNPALARMYGYESPDGLMAHLSNIERQLYVDPGRRDDFIRLMREQGQVRGFESRIFRRDGAVIWISENARAVRDEAGAVRYYEGTVMDITERKEAEESLAREQARLSRLFEDSRMGIVMLDPQARIVKANQSFLDMFGLEPQIILGRYNRELVVPEDLMPESLSLNRAVTAGQSVQVETRRRHASGRVFPVALAGHPILMRRELEGIYYIYQDISERKRFEEQITHQAFHDALTDLPNRVLLRERLERAIQRSRRREDFRYAVLLIDLDRFKWVNDTLGHQAGDELLIAMTRRLMSSVRASDTLARLGGDEFAVLLEEYDSPREVIKITKRILNLIRRPVTIEGQTVHSSASIGVVYRTGGYEQADHVLRDADIAMYRAKERGRGRFKAFNTLMHEEAAGAMRLEGELREAVRLGLLEVHYQPILNASSGRLDSLEALLRWRHPERGMIPPNRFIPLAEETGLIEDIGRFVLHEACRQLRKWRENVPGMEEVTMNVNISSKQFQRRDLSETVSRALRETGLPPRLLKIELTESMIIQNVKSAAEQFERLKKLGVGLAIDDFGTGYSSLSYLHQFPIDTLKIDRSFISDMLEDGGTGEIIRTIVGLARNLGMDVVAEGVEKAEQWQSLKNLSCDRVQGFLFSRPLSGEEFPARFRELMETASSAQGEGLERTDKTG